MLPSARRSGRSTSAQTVRRGPDNLHLFSRLGTAPDLVSSSCSTSRIVAEARRFVPWPRFGRVARHRPCGRCTARRFVDNAHGLVSRRSSPTTRRRAGTRRSHRRRTVSLPICPQPEDAEVVWTPADRLFRSAILVAFGSVSRRRRVTMIFASARRGTDDVQQDNPGEIVCRHLWRDVVVSHATGDDIARCRSFVVPLGCRRPSAANRTTCGTFERSAYRPSSDRFGWAKELRVSHCRSPGATPPLAAGGGRRSCRSIRRRARLSVLPTSLPTVAWAGSTRLCRRHRIHRKRTVSAYWGHRYGDGT